MKPDAPLSSLFSRRLEPPPPAAASGPKRDLSIQGLRACAALFVMTEHLAPNLPGLGHWLRNLGASAGGVMLFFVISGYVIGLATKQPWSAGSRADYWRRRLVRLAPLYFLAVTFALIVSAWFGVPLSLPDTVANFLCLQNLQPYGPLNFKPVTTDGAIWSLHYEMVFYALFLLVWRFRPTVLTAFGLSLFVAVGAAFLPDGAIFLSGYASGFVFWLAGLWLAWCRPRPAAETAGDSGFPAAGLLLLLIALHASVPEQVLRVKLGIDWEALAFVNPFNLIYLPVCFLLVGGAARRLPPPGKLARLICILPPALTLVLALLHNSHLTETRWAVTALTTVIGGALLWTPAGSRALPRLAWIGAISYALYLFHSPIHLVFRHLFALPPYTLFALVVLVSFAVAWLLEGWLPARLRPLSRSRKPEPVPACPS